jgi:hypothetical protein
MFPVDAPPSVDCLLAVSQRCCDILDFPAFQSSVGDPTSSLLGSIHHVTLPRLCPNDTLRDTSGWIAQWERNIQPTTNLGEVQDRLATFAELTEEDRARVSSRIETLLKVTEDEPKAFAWKLRARVGAKSKWYNEVDSVGA